MLNRNLGKQTKQHMQDGARNSIIAGFITLWLICNFTVLYDYRYELNDDVLIHDILSGNYTGVPEGRAIQLLYPLGAILALGYTIFRQVPWFGFFVCGAQFLCCYLFLKRTLQYGTNRVEKLLVLLAGTSLFMLFQYHALVVVQYTVVAGLLATVGIYLFITSEPKNTTREMLKENAFSILLLLIGFCLREEIVLLFLPFLCVAGVIKWIDEEHPFAIGTVKRYLGLIITLLAGMGFCVGIHMVAYGSEAWKEFGSFFDERTKLYDYASVPTYEEHIEFYKSIGMEQESQQLLVNYNFALDESIDAERMRQVAAYATARWEEEYPWKEQIRTSIIAYQHRLLDTSRATLAQSDYPYNYMVILLYGITVLLILFRRKYRYCIPFILLGVVRSVIWIYLLYGMRTPVRITVPLYFVEACILFALVLELASELKSKKYSIGVVVLLLISMMGICNLTYVEGCLKESLAFQEEQDVYHDAIRSYAKENPDGLYMIDVYTYVYFSEKIFAERDNSLDNYGIMSGWSAKSPLEEKRLEEFGIEQLGEAFLKKDNLYLINHRQYHVQWLVDYYRSQDRLVEIEEVDSLVEGQLQVLQVREVS